MWCTTNNIATLYTLINHYSKKIFLIFGTVQIYHNIYFIEIIINVYIPVLIGIFCHVTPKGIVVICHVTHLLPAGLSKRIELGWFCGHAPMVKDPATV